MLDVVFEHFAKSVIKVHPKSRQVENDTLDGDDRALEALPDLVNVYSLELHGVHATGQVLGEELVNRTAAENSPRLIDTMPG